MTERPDYKTMMEQIHAPSSVVEKARNIPMEKGAIKQAFKRNALHYSAAAAAVLVAVFIVSNGVCYAATGETWVEKATVYVNGEPEEMDVTMSQPNDETTIAEITYDTADGNDEISMTFTAEGGEGISANDIEINDYTVSGDGSDVESAMVLESKDGKVIVAPDGVEPIDITDQIREQGGAIGTFERDGNTYVYKVWGEAGAYSASVELESEAF